MLQKTLTFYSQNITRDRVYLPLSDQIHDCYSPVIFIGSKIWQKNKALIVANKLPLSNVFFLFFFAIRSPNQQGNPNSNKPSPM